jgi:2',3'-cyclic-nucleotide 2'-phosphodiesterase (5'-nucleotidase family)
MHSMLTQGFEFSQGETEHKNLVNEHAASLRDQGADIVVVMSELGIHKTKQLADVVNKGVDIFFAAHTHEVTYTPIMSASEALVVEAGNDGYLGRMDVEVKTSRRRGNSITDFNWSIIELDDSVAEDLEMKALVDAERAQFFADNVAIIAPPPFFIQTLTMPLDTRIGHTDSLMNRKDALEGSFNNGFTDMLRNITGTEVAMTPGFRMGTTVAAPGGYMDELGHVAEGDITLEDAFRFIPMLYAVATGQVSGARLKEIIEEQLTKTFSADTFNHTGGWNYGFSGLDMDLNLEDGDGQRIKTLSYSGSGVAVGNSDNISITGCQRLPIEFAGTLCAYEGFTNVEPYTGILAAGETLTALDLFVDALGSSNFNGNRSSITDASNTPLWPDDDFIQPLEGVGSSDPAQDGDDCGFFGMCDGGGFGGGSVFGFGF